jgi:ATPase subunit of ABC transporter with duplicated ATPase domains
LLPQRLDALDDLASVLDNVRRAAPEASPQATRAALARFLFRGDDVDRPAGTLSGGERFRASLAAILLATPAPQLLILDEPTNSLDIASVTQLVSALECYRGALVVASHDWAFLRECRLTRWLTLDGNPTQGPTHPGHRSNLGEVSRAPARESPVRTSSIEAPSIETPRTPGPGQGLARHRLRAGE